MTDIRQCDVNLHCTTGTQRCCSSCCKNMRHETDQIEPRHVSTPQRYRTDPIEPGHVSVEKPGFLRFPSLGWQTCVSPPVMTVCARGHSSSRLGFVSGPIGPGAGSASFVRAGPPRTGGFDPLDTRVSNGCHHHHCTTGGSPAATFQAENESWKPGCPSPQKTKDDGTTRCCKVVCMSLRAWMWRTAAVSPKHCEVALVATTW